MSIYELGGHSCVSLLVVLYVQQLVAVCHLMFISFCLCITVRSAIVFNYVREF